MAMMTPSLPGYRVECIGDDIAWMYFDKQGNLRAVNPENGFFGVCPGTNHHTNPIAMETIKKNTIFTNVAKTSSGRVYWEGLEQELQPGDKIRSWLGDDWTPALGSGPAAHSNSRFTIIERCIEIVTRDTFKPCADSVCQLVNAPLSILVGRMLKVSSSMLLFSEEGCHMASLWFTNHLTGNMEFL